MTDVKEPNVQFTDTEQLEDGGGTGIDQQGKSEKSWPSWKSGEKQSSKQTKGSKHSSSGGGLDNTKLMVGGVLMAFLFAAVSGLYGVIYASQQKMDSNNADVIDQLEDLEMALISEGCPAKSDKFASNLYTTLKNGVKVVCDTDTEGGRWVIFQRRSGGWESFNRTYAEFAWGFGDLEGDFWLGLENIHYLCQQNDKCELWVEVRTKDPKGGITKNPEGFYYAKYDTFYMGCANNFYILMVDGYSGTAGDALKNHKGANFSTWDQQNNMKDENCGKQGGFWHGNCNDTTIPWANINGVWGDKASNKWPALTDGDLYFTEMKLRFKK